MKKTTKSKPVKTGQSSATAAADQDVVVLLTTLVQKLASFEAKLDTVLTRIPAQPSAVPRQQLAPTPSPERRREPRPMHKTICADCGKNCEVPFRPSAGRPVYCKECFTARKKNGTFNPRGDNRPKEIPSVHTLPFEKAQAVEPAKPSKKRKTAAGRKKKSKARARKK